MFLRELFVNPKKPILEGNNIWPDTEPFDQAIADQLADETNRYLTGTGETATVYRYGSGATPTPGKFSNDLDVMVDLAPLMQTFDTKDGKTTRVELEKFLQAKGLATKKTGTQVHIRLPYKGKFHQVDIKVVPNAEHVHKLHIHDIPAGSPYKGVHKQVLLSTLASHKGMLYSPDEGLYARDDQGKKSHFITYDLDEIAKHLFGPHATAAAMGSVESILKNIHDPELQKQLLQRASEGSSWQTVSPKQINEASAPSVGRKYQHIEDLIFTNGSVGGLHAIERLRHMTTKGGTIELKWDGSPVVYWGRDEQGRFHMFPKNAWDYIKRGTTHTKSGVSTMMNDPDDVMQFLLGTGRTEPGKESQRQTFAQDMASLWPYFETISPESGFLEGGILFDPSQPPVLNPTTGDYDFTPNITSFHIPSNSDLGKKIAKAKVMVAATGYYTHIGGEEGRYANAEQLSTRDVIVQGTTYVEHPPKIDHAGLDHAEEYIKKNKALIDSFIAGQPGLSNPGDKLYTFFNQNLRVAGVKQKFVDWANSTLSAGQAQKLISHPGLDAVLTAVEMLTHEKMKVISALSTGTHGGIRQTKPEGYVQAHPGGKFKYDLPGQFVKTIDQANWAPRKDNIQENINRTGESKAAVVGWGRGMGHKGHMYLASSVITQAAETGADPYFVVSRTVGKDDPITPEEKMQIYRKVFPKHGHIFHTATDEMPDLTRVLTQLDKHGYTDVVVVVGEDQKNALSYVTQYNGRPDKAGNIPFTFNSLNVISRQETNDPSREEEGPRATPMRQVLNDPEGFKAEHPDYADMPTKQMQFAVWRDAMDSQISDEEVLDLMHKAQQRMSDPTFGKAPKKAKPVKENLVKYANKVIREMRAQEFMRKNLAEGDVPYAGKGSEKLHHVHIQALKNAMSIPNISMNKANGSPYMQYRFGIALANPTQTPRAGAMSGDPLITAYTEEELEKVKLTAKMMGAGSITHLSDGRSNEAEGGNIVSPVRKQKKNKYGI
jgi:Family of unknown function (DUF6267)